MDKQQWQPIETAPKDGTSVRLLSERGNDVGYWCDYSGREPAAKDPESGEVLHGEWSTELGNGEPTHWMPLPAPPNTAPRA